MSRIEAIREPQSIPVQLTVAAGSVAVARFPGGRPFRATFFGPDEIIDVKDFEMDAVSVANAATVTLDTLAIGEVLEWLYIAFSVTNASNQFMIRNPADDANLIRQTPINAKTSGPIAGTSIETQVVIKGPIAGNTNKIQVLDGGTGGMTVAGIITKTVKYNLKWQKVTALTAGDRDGFGLLADPLNASTTRIVRNRQRYYFDPKALPLVAPLAGSPDVAHPFAIEIANATSIAQEMLVVIDYKGV